MLTKNDQYPVAFLGQAPLKVQIVLIFMTCSLT